MQKPVDQQNSENNRLELNHLTTKEHLAHIAKASLTDTHKSHPKQFGSTFFLRPTASPRTEKDGWAYLEAKLHRRIKP